MSSENRRYLRSLAALLAGNLSLATPGLAMMAGTAPDSPAARVDANTAESTWAGVVVVVNGTSPYAGVAVSPRHILTAAHVAGGGPANVSIILNAGDEPQRLDIAHIDIFPSYAFPYDDLALLTLSEPLPAGVPDYPVNDLPPEPGKTVLTLVGYGGSGTGDLGPSTASSKTTKRVGQNVLDALRTKVDASEHTSSFYLYDFDGPDGNGPFGGPTLGNAQETMVAGGDSGSPAFTLLNGYQALTGINTFASPLNSERPLNYGFGQGGGGMLLSDPRFIQWLVEKSGHSVRLLSSLQVVGRADYRWPALVGGVLISGIAGAVWWQRRRS